MPPLLFFSGGKLPLHSKSLKDTPLQLCGATQEVCDMQGYDVFQLVTTVVAEAAKENKSDKDNNPSVFAVYSVTKAATHCVFLLVMFE